MNVVSNRGKLVNPMNYHEIMEAEATQKGEALRKISAMIKCYDITPADLQAIVPDLANLAGRKSLPEARPLIPFLMFADPGFREIN